MFLCETLFYNKLLLLMRSQFFVKQIWEKMNFMFRPNISISRVGWEGFSPLLTENFSSFPPYDSLTRIFPTHENISFSNSFPTWSLKKATPFGPGARKVLTYSPVLKRNRCCIRISFLFSHVTLRCTFCFGETSSIYALGFG